MNEYNEVASLNADINKAKGEQAEENTEGVVSPKYPELTLKMKDSKLVDMLEEREKAWLKSDIRKKWIEQGKMSTRYWIGEHRKFDTGENKPCVDNLIFESLETYLPQVTRRNPEPLVTLHSTEKTDKPNANHDKFITKVKDRLADLSDENKLRLKLKKVARHWSIYLLGVVKHVWDLEKDIPGIRVIRPHKIILDPEAVIDEDGYSGELVGEYRKKKASSLIQIIKNSEMKGKASKIKFIKEKVENKLSTEIQYVEWWSDEYFCWKLDKTILLKGKNHFWNYDRKEVVDTFDDMGQPIQKEEMIEGVNHFPIPKKPYTFLVVFNLGDQPVDNTSLIIQNISNQDSLNRRNKQIDDNIDHMNEGMIVSLARSGLSSEDAANVSRALRNGGIVMVPDGAPREAIDRIPASSLPADVYAQLTDRRNRLRDIFGTSGSSAGSVQNEKTVRGKIISRSLDTDRIGGGVSEYLEQVADEIYNWQLQLLYVYDPEFIPVGEQKPPKLNISVKEGSLLPKDTTSIANQAMELASAGKMSTVDMYKRLEYPNAEDLAANAWLEANAPQILFEDNPKVQKAIQMQQQQAMAQEQAKAEAEIQKQQAKLQGEIQKSVVTEQVKAQGDIVEERIG